MNNKEIARRETAGFRHALRFATREAHDGAEHQFARFHANPASEMHWFLSTQRAGLAALDLARLDQQRGASQVALEDLIERLDFDLTTAGVRAVQVQAERPLHNLAIDYLVLGSRLGTEVLRRALARDMAREDMPTYFLAPSTGALWQRHCRTLDDIPVDSSEAARIIEDVKHGFSLFEQAAALQDRAQSAPKTEGEPA